MSCTEGERAARSGRVARGTAVAVEVEAVVVEVVVVVVE
jgi:hypothetical protein